MAFIVLFALWFFIVVLSSTINIQDLFDKNSVANSVPFLVLIASMFIINMLSLSGSSNSVANSFLFFCVLAFDHFTE